LSAGESWSELSSHYVIVLHWSDRLRSVQVHHATTQETDDSKTGISFGGNFFDCTHSLKKPDFIAKNIR
jgi:hypothetical protein